MTDHMEDDSELTEREAWLCAVAAGETTGTEYSRLKALALEAVPPSSTAHQCQICSGTGEPK